MENELIKTVIAPECAQELKKLGFKHQSLYYWIINGESKILASYDDLEKIIEGFSIDMINRTENFYPALSAAEIESRLKNIPRGILRMATEFSFKLHVKPFQNPIQFVKQPLSIGDSLNQFISEILKTDDLQKTLHRAPTENLNEEPNGDDN